MHYRMRKQSSFFFFFVYFFFSLNFYNSGIKRGYLPWGVGRGQLDLKGPGGKVRQDRRGLEYSSGLRSVFFIHELRTKIVI